MFLDLSCNTLLVALVLLRVASVGQPRGVQDVNEKTLYVVTMLTSANLYNYIVVGCKFVEAGGVGLTPVVRTTLFAGDVEVVVTSIVAAKDTGNELQE